MTPLSPTALEEAAKAYRDVTFNALTLDECRDAATAAITAYLAQASREGWVMVPARTARSLAMFFAWAMQDGPFDGDDLDGASIQDKAESLGLINATKFDPKKHGDKPWAAPGDEWFVIADDVQGLLAAAQNGGE